MNEFWIDFCLVWRGFFENKVMMFVLLLMFVFGMVVVVVVLLLGYGVFLCLFLFFNDDEIVEIQMVLICVEGNVYGCLYLDVVDFRVWVVFFEKVGIF